MESKLSTMWKIWKIILDLLCQLVEVNAWKREPRSNEYDTPRDILNTFFGMFEPSGLIMNATDKTFFPPDWGMLRRSRCIQIFL